MDDFVRIVHALVVRRDVRRAATGAALACLVASGRLRAQSIDPPIAVYDGRAAGTIVIANGSLFPVNFVLEPKSFAVSCVGDVAFSPLDTTRIRLKLSAMSGRIAARQNVRVFYQAVADSLPSWFAIVASFSRSAPAEGLSVRLELPHIVYMMQHDRVLERDISVGDAVFDSLTKSVRVRVENHSPKLTRVQELSLLSSTGQAFAVEACPLFPNSARDFEFPWRETGRPATVVVKFPGFAVSRPVTAAVQPPRPVPPSR